MSDLVRFYKNYYREQTPSSIESLFKSMMNYDFSSYQKDITKIFRMYCETKSLQKPLKLYTNGSSSGFQQYFYFAPNFSIWQHKIEPFLRDKQYKTIMLVTMLGEKNISGFGVQEVEGSSQKDFDFSLNWSDEENIKKLFEFINKIYEEYGKVNLYSVPCVWTCFVTNPLFRDLVLLNREKIHALVNSDYDPYFKRFGIYVRDQMMDWGTGMNFFSCKNNKKHFLPLFFHNGKESVNLINLKQNSIRTDDLFELDIDICECGNPCSATIECHFANKIKDHSGSLIEIQALIDELKSRYANFQIHQNLSNDITVYSTVLKDENDSTLIRNYFEKRCFKIDFIADRYYDIGRKRYVAWRSSFVEPQEFIKQESSWSRNN